MKNEPENRQDKGTEQERPQAIAVKDLCTGYEDTIIISALSMSFPAGKITMLIGPNGCGKSTLLKTIGRILTPKKGDVLLDGQSIRTLAPKEVARQMAVLPQSPVAPAGLLVRELVAYGRYPYQAPMASLTREDLEIVQWAMTSTGVAEFADRDVASLSGGQRQRTWIAMALAQKTGILVLDEPTTYLDMAHQLEILKLVQDLNRTTGITVLIVIHELNHAIRFADEIIGMKDGWVIFQGPPRDVITTGHLRALYGIEARLETDATGTYPICVEYDLST